MQLLASNDGAEEWRDVIPNKPEPDAAASPAGYLMRLFFILCINLESIS